MTQTRIPDLFIVGAPRCGTTALYTYLREHPEIFMSAIKEPNFFADYLGERRRVRTWTEYLRCFADARGEKRIGEASVFYLASHTSARAVKQFSPQARIIIMLRNPVEVMYSLYHLRRFENLEDESSFEAALRADARGRKGPELSYRERVSFASQVERYLSVFRRERIHFIIYDDFKRDPRAIFEHTLRFLEVNSGIERQFATINGNRRARSRIVWRVLRRPPEPLRKIIHPITSRRIRTVVGSYLFRLNAVQEQRPPMDPELRVRLEREFVGEIERLSTLLNRDLTGWCRTQLK